MPNVKQAALGTRCFGEHRGMIKTQRTSQAVLLSIFVAVCTGCASYKREPLSPVELQKQLRRYSLADLASEYSRMKPSEKPPDVTDGLGVDEVGLAALVLNPALKTKRLSENIACGQLVTAGLYPNPTLDSKSLLTSQKPTGRKSLEASLSFEVLRWREIAAEKEAKRANVEAIHFDSLAEEWKTVSDARAAYWTVVGLREKLRLNKEELELSARLLESVKTRIKHGAGTALDSNLADLQHLKLQAETQKLEADEAAAMRALRLAIGLPWDAELKLRVSEKPLALASRSWTREQLLASLTDSATMKAAEWRYNVSEGDLRAAIARQYPSLKLGPSSTFDFDGHIWSSLTGLVATVDIPLLHRNQGEVREKTAARDVARADYTAKLQAAEAALADASSQVESNEKRLTIHEKELLPRAEESIRLTEKAYKAGDVSGYELQTARALLIEVKKSHLDLLIELRQSLQAAEAALGRRLDDISGTGKAGKTP